MGRTGVILTTRSRDDFFGEAERQQGFQRTLGDMRPDLRIVDISGGGGLFSSTLSKVKDVATTQDVLGVYSMGGGNRAILAELARGAGRRPFFIAHDLDKENLNLLDAGQLDFVLYHDLARDMRHLFQRFAAAHRLARDSDATYSSDIQVITPFNVPQSLRPPPLTNA
jgi:LacI family transcriptional regulator